MTDAADASTPDPTPNAYPVPKPSDGDDPRFTLGLSIDVARILEAAGYPKFSSIDFVDLNKALFGFLYGPRQAPPTEEDTSR
ncbi:hypothetical protein [Streptosporangium sp. NPDC048865]|uniref:hypothetical protein n=1 Tax=Streptosporangium sp. NPDC048865 TaxID=3155766 RepID=UPI003449A9EB